ncbi:ATP-grasp domain-containing protein [Lentzea sp. CA-135723]|uniref:ATP-grasp domain-containing protein n=1 Tax=Lentzea sp. CA-135723 TaxID=3239950 RepID=UPI003D9318CD
MSEHVLIFGHGPNIDYGTLLRAHPDVTTSLICRPESLTKFGVPEGHQRIIAIPKGAPIEEVVAQARAIPEPVTRIGAFWELDQERAAAVGAALGVPTHHPSTVRAVSDKDAMRERLRSSGVDDTAAALVTSPSDIIDFGTRHGYPLVVKPVAASGSCGVRVVRSVSEATEAYAVASGDFLGVTRAEVMVEQFHVGAQFSVESFSDNGEHVVVAITKKYSDPHSLIELGHVCPAELDPADQAAIENYVTDVLKALDVQLGATHTEVVLTTAGPRIIETHLRIGGDFIFDLVRDATGVDLVDLQVRQTLRRPVLEEARPKPSHHEAIWYAPPTAAGTFAGMTAPPTVTALHEPGTDLTGLSGSWSRLAHARATGSTAESAVAAAQEAITATTFDIKLAATIPFTV